MNNLPLTTPTELEATGSQEAWWEKYRGYIRLVLDTQIDPRLRGKVDLSGVVQQTLFEAYRDRGLQQSSTAEQTVWLRRVLANNLADEVRKYRSDKRDVGRELAMNFTDDMSLDRMTCLVANVSSPSAPARREESALLLAAALDRLPAGAARSPGAAALARMYSSGNRYTSGPNAHGSR